MAGEQLEKTLDVDLSSLDAKLKQQEVLWKSIDEGSAQVEKKLTRQKLNLQQFERQIENMGGRLRRISKGVLQDVVGSGLSAIPGLNQGVIGRVSNLAADAAFGGFGAAGVAFAAIMLAIGEIKEQIRISKERDKELERRLQEQQDRFTTEVARIEKEGDDRRRVEAREKNELEIKMYRETQELLYQSSQYLDQ